MSIKVTPQEFINNAPFKHAYPWRTVCKEDSISTPYRLVVDPTMSGLNLILAKGESKVQSIHEVVLRNRTKRHVWSSDISKMYNCLHLNKSSLPYSLFLFQDEMDPTKKPVVYVMRVAWYGVVPTGNQAGYAIEVIANSASDSLSVAKTVLLLERYVDDLLSGANSEEVRDQQIEQVKELLSTGGFKLKFVAKSGEPPCEKASENGVDMKVLGYNWVPLTDQLSPGFSEINFNKKVRGVKKPNAQPVTTKEDAENLMKDLVLTRKHCVSKVAEIYDPEGLWEPIKLEFKLELAKLNDVDWDQPIPDELQVIWKQRLLKLLDLPNIKIDRS